MAKSRRYTAPVPGSGWPMYFQYFQSKSPRITKNTTERMSRAMVVWLGRFRTPPRDGSLPVFMEGRPADEVIGPCPGDLQVQEVSDLEPLLRPGKEDPGVDLRRLAVAAGEEPSALPAV